MYYVAATRARDLLALPRAAHQGAHGIRHQRARQRRRRGPGRALRAVPPRRVPEWAQAAEPAAARPIIGDAALQQQLDAVRDRFRAQLAVATQPIARPTSVTQARDAEADDEEPRLTVERAHKVDDSRYGRGFGIVVHRALELVHHDAEAATVAAVVDLVRALDSEARLLIIRLGVAHLRDTGAAARWAVSRRRAARESDHGPRRAAVAAPRHR